MSDGVHYDSFVTYQRVLDNMEFIRQKGVERYAELQKTRINLLETMLELYNDGRSKSYYCIAAALLPTEDIVAAMKETRRRIETDHIPPEDHKIRAEILKELLNGSAMKQGIELKLRKKK